MPQSKQKKEGPVTLAARLWPKDLRRVEQLRRRLARELDGQVSFADVVRRMLDVIFDGSCIPDYNEEEKGGDP